MADAAATEEADCFRAFGFRSWERGVLGVLSLGFRVRVCLGLRA